MNKHEINTIINVEAKLDRTNDLKRQLEGISSAGKLLNDTKAFREASKGIEGITNQVRRLTKELDTLRSAQMQSAKSTQAKYGTSPRAGGFYLPQGKEILPFLERFSRAHGGLEQFQSHLARAVQQHAQTSQGQGRRTRRFHGQVAHLQQVAQAYYGQQRDFCFCN